ncbi:MAG: 4Fe-4S dicluster domain-containing protein, partial [Halocynthiibacter sp.]
MPKHLILCDCLGSQTIDPEAMEKACGLTCSRLHSSLCTDQIEFAAKAIQAGDAIIACQQEHRRFEDLADEIGASAPGFVDLRDRAGWTRDKGSKLAKMAALAAEAALTVPQGRSVDVISEGVCLIVGAPDAALSAARDLCEILSVTVLLDRAAEQPPDERFDTIRGVLKRADGALGGFSVRIDALQQIVPGGRGEPQYTAPKDGGTSDCDIILDLSGGTPLFSAPDKREGYLRADPKSAPAVASAVLQASQLTGTFEKPLYVRLEASLCAHSRAGKVACTNCLDICPDGAILPNGDHVTIDPMICAGCGACAAVCPSGAVSYDAPPVDVIFRRIETLARTFREAGGGAPRLLVCDTGHGREMISLSARYGDGLPADVIPLAVEALAGFGHAEMLAALACGFSSIDVLVAPTTERDALMRELALAEAIAGPDKLRLLDLGDPDALSDALYEVSEQSVVS